MKFFIYSRKSVYTGKGESIENQIEMCKHYISTKFSNITDKNILVYEDDGFSARNTDRPQFQQMLRAIKTNKPDFIVCYRLDRISRNVSDFSTLIENLNEHNISFVCVKEEFDTSKPMGKAMMYIASVFAQLERETIAERVRDNMLMLARMGHWLGGTTPTGFTSEKVQEIIIDNKVKTSYKLKDNVDELVVIDTIFQKFLEVHSISGVSKYLIKQNIKSRSGKYYSLLGIKEILQNPVYCIADIDALNYFIENNADVCFSEKDCSNTLGLLVYNKRNYTKKHAPRQSMDKWVVAIGKHKGRILGEKWIAVQNIIKSNIPTGEKPTKMHNDYSLLSGLIYCEKCGSRMFAKPRKGRCSDYNLYDYICNNKLRGGVELCNCQNINGQQADDMVYEYLIDYINENSDIYKLLEKLKCDLKGEVKKNPVNNIETQIKKCNEEMNNLINILSQGNISTVLIQHVNTRVIELDKELSELTKEHEQSLKGIDPIIDKEIQVDMIASALSSLKNNFNTLTVHEKRILIKLLIKKVVWDGENLHIFIDGE